MVFARNFAVLLVVMLACGCTSTHTIPMNYEPTAEVAALQQGGLAISVGEFQDRRGRDPRWLGAIRGGYGNVLKELLTDQPTSVSVQDAFIKALETRKANYAPSVAQVSVEGEILKLDCSYFFNREAHTFLRVNVVSLKDKSILYSHEYRTDNTEAGAGAGIFGDPLYLGAFGRRTVNETIDKAFADPAFIEALKGISSK